MIRTLPSDFVSTLWSYFDQWFCLCMIFTNIWFLVQPSPIVSHLAWFWSNTAKWFCSDAIIWAKLYLEWLCSDIMILAKLFLVTLPWQMTFGQTLPSRYMAWHYDFGLCPIGISGLTLWLRPLSSRYMTWHYGLVKLCPVGIWPDVMTLATLCPVVLP